MALKQVTGVEIVRALLAAGRRKEAADLADEAAYRRDTDLHLLVNILASELRKAGDRHMRRGRPVAKDQSWESMRITLARSRYRAAIVARRLVDGERFDPDVLSSFAFAVTARPEEVPDGLLVEEFHVRTSKVFAEDLNAAHSNLKPFAMRLLKFYKLHPGVIARKGFRAATRRAIATAWGVSESTLARELGR